MQRLPDKYPREQILRWHPVSAENKQQLMAFLKSIIGNGGNVYDVENRA
jgi:hypothetical protein